jgi:Protein of unknown function (DUF3300)
MPRALASILFVAFVVLSASLPGWAQQPSPPAGIAASATSQQELDRLLAPIALYPDALIAQILMASTYPLEVVYAARWSKGHPDIKGKALEDEMKKQDWAAEVKALTAVPQVLNQMSENIGWMQKLGDAVLGDQKAVLETVQSLRAKAQAAGNLKSTPEQTVRTEVQESKSVIIIEPTQSQTVYVPTYDPYSIYGPWWYSYPPYYMYPPGYYYPPGLAFASGVFWGAVIAGGITWGGGGNWNINVGGGGNWGHHVEHRRGVAYGDNKVAQKYNRGGDRQAVQSREQFRARADSGRSQLQSMDRSQLQNRASAGNRASGTGDRAASRDTGGRSGGGASTRDLSSRGSGSGFSGANSGSSTRQASSRGSSSRGSMGGSRGGGGGRGGGRR